MKEAKEIPTIQEFLLKIRANSEKITKIKANL